MVEIRDINPNKIEKRIRGFSPRWGTSNRIKNAFPLIEWINSKGHKSFIYIHPTELTLIREIQEEALKYYDTPKKKSLQMWMLCKRLEQRRNIKTRINAIPKALIYLTLYDPRFSLRAKRNKIAAHKVSKFLDFHP